jgi:hypothetical protein
MAGSMSMHRSSAVIGGAVSLTELAKRAAPRCSSLPRTFAHAMGLHHVTTRVEVIRAFLDLHPRRAAYGTLDQSECAEAEVV